MWGGDEQGTGQMLWCQSPGGRRFSSAVGKALSPSVLSDTGGAPASEERGALEGDRAVACWEIQGKLGSRAAQMVRALQDDRFDANRLE